ncbi:hypothetical protein OG579_13820 [Williamsia herbipolensis]|uniref:Uncharacterized protein n=1 Tax=Williamsia herbipolensis TaxID=1603258 RepID=A0AAU4JYJ5_9NOCA|nr:hypothetical protein [Williamsia herbipolensis]
MAAAAILAPERALRAFRIPVVDSASSTTFRMFGIRNAVLAHQLFTIDDFENPRRLLLINSAVDIADAIAVLVATARKELSPVTAAIGLSVALGASSMGAVAAQRWPEAGGAPSNRATVSRREAVHPRTNEL